MVCAVSGLRCDLTLRAILRFSLRGFNHTKARPMLDDLPRMINAGRSVKTHMSIDGPWVGEQFDAMIASTPAGCAVASLAGAVRDHRELLARIVVAEQGKPSSQARGEIAATGALLRQNAEYVRRIEREIVPSDAGDQDISAGRRCV